MPHPRGVAQSGSALALGARCREFKSLHPDQILRQPPPRRLCLSRARSSNWIEHQPSKLGVVGSTPAGRATSVDFPNADNPCKRKEASDDRSPYLAHAQWAQDPHHARGNRARVRGSAGEHPHRRAVQTGVPENQPEQQDPRDRGPQRAGRKADRGLRVGSDSRLSGGKNGAAASPFFPPDKRESPPTRAGRKADRGLRVGSDSRLSGGKNGEAAAPRRSRKVRRAAVADVPDGFGRPDDGAGRAFQEQRRARTHRVRNQPLHERGQALARRDGEAAIGGAVLRWLGVLHRRYRDFSVASRERAKRNRLGGVPQGQEVVRRNRRAPSRAARAEGARRRPDYTSRTVRSESTRDPVRRDAVSASLRGNPDRKSTRLNSSHLVISYAVFCLKKKKEQQSQTDSDIQGT